MEKVVKEPELKIGIVGLGLMGCSIAVAFLTSGYEVVGIAPVEGEAKGAFVHIKRILSEHAANEKTYASRDVLLENLTLSEEYHLLKDCNIVLECVIEKTEVKKRIYNNIADFVGSETVIATNTSAIPISYLQKFVPLPHRFLGIHWAEPAYNTRFLEIICGDQTDIKIANWIYKLAHQWGKEPTLLEKDIRGFIANRLMYASFREALSIAEKGIATMDDIDRCFRYDMGSWMTLMGVFRRMDFLGLNDFFPILKERFLALENSKEVPEIMETMVKENARGIHNLNGLYSYTKDSAIRWEENFERFTQAISLMAGEYPVDIVEKNLLKK